MPDTLCVFCICFVQGFVSLPVTKSGFVCFPSDLGTDSPSLALGAAPAVNLARVMLGLVFLQLNFSPEYGALGCRTDTFDYNVCSFQLSIESAESYYSELIFLK